MESKGYCFKGGPVPSSIVGGMVYDTRKNYFCIDNVAHSITRRIPLPSVPIIRWTTMDYNRGPYTPREPKMVSRTVTINKRTINIDRTNDLQKLIDFVVYYLTYGKVSNQFKRTFASQLQTKELRDIFRSDMPISRDLLASLRAPALDKQIRLRRQHDVGAQVKSQDYVIVDGTKTVKLVNYVLPVSYVDDDGRWIPSVDPSTVELNSKHRGQPWSARWKDPVNSKLYVYTLLNFFVDEPSLSSDVPSIRRKRKRIDDDDDDAPPRRRRVPVSAEFIEDDDDDDDDDDELSEDEREIEEREAQIGEELEREFMAELEEDVETGGMSIRKLLEPSEFAEARLAIQSIGKSGPVDLEQYRRPFVIRVGPDTRTSMDKLSSDERHLPFYYLPPDSKQREIIDELVKTTYPVNLSYVTDDVLRTYPSSSAPLETYRRFRNINI